MRGAITSLNWFFPRSLFAFAPDDLSQALEFLRSHSDATLPTGMLLETLRSLAGEVGQPLPLESVFANLMRQRRVSEY